MKKIKLNGLLLAGNNSEEERNFIAFQGLGNTMLSSLQTQKKGSSVEDRVCIYKLEHLYIDQDAIISIGECSESFYIDELFKQGTFDDKQYKYKQSPDVKSSTFTLGQSFTTKRKILKVATFNQIFDVVVTEEEMCALKNLFGIK